MNKKQLLDLIKDLKDEDEILVLVGNSNDDDVFSHINRGSNLVDLFKDYEFEDLRWKGDDWEGSEVTPPFKNSFVLCVDSEGDRFQPYLLEEEEEEE